MHFLKNIFKKLIQLFSNKEEDSKAYKYVKLERNSKCYCKSEKKYKHCHLKINGKKGLVALKKIDDKGNEKIELFYADKVNIKVKNTFSPIDVSMAGSD